MPDGFNSKDLQKPPGRRELARIDKEWKALEIWRDTGDLKKVRDQINATPGMSCKNVHEARILVNRGVERFDDDRKDQNRARYVRQAMINDRMITLLNEAIEAGDLTRMKDLMSVFERQAKLHDLDDARKDAAQVGVQFIVNTGLPDIPDVQPAQIIEGEVVDDV